MMNTQLSVEWLILLAALVTLFTRVAGYLVLSRIKRIPHRIDAALNAVPIAVLSALVTPGALARGWPESVAMLIAGLVALRLSSVWVVSLGLLALVLFRQL